ncbi:serine/threonine-protein kinase [Tumidithrix elongata RA019]|uniref:Serine/threonine-protein kinase n=1 Tax=Tumidithrix elongata BACA0141 TaxID=2716417 RepID=A0AAW9Q8B3_9CYAN|nr:serine/threonine-protein kinase [Tumidithrix elongata RA019]
MTASQQSNPWIGRTVGDRNRYRITSRLGGGGMGDVFLAVDTLLGQQVALKLLKEKLLGEGDLRQRFEREVLLCAAIQSENVVQVKDYGVIDEGYPFYVMEYLRGQTLGQLLQKEKRLSVERSVGIISQVCDGLHKAHQGVVMSHDGATSGELVQIVHRDLKPENIFLVHTSLGELVKVLDFGIAKVFSNETPSTNTGLFMGTFQYAAPEQIEARKDLDLRADIYSIGMILYEMLSGSDPFGCSLDGNAAGGTCWLRSHVYEPPRSLRSQPDCEHLSIKLEAVVMQCLRKVPSGRFSSVSALNQALQTATGIKVDARTMMRSLTSSAETIIMKPVVADPPVPVTSDSTPSQSVRASQFTSYLSYMQVKVEPILLNYIGPIAPILLKQASSQASSPSDLIKRLIQHIPANKQSEFKAAVKTAIGTVDTNPGKGQKTAPPSVPPTAMPSNQQISQIFIDRCEKELAEIIGPMARLILQKTLALKPSSQAQLVEMLAEQIPNPTYAAKFRQRLG